MDKANNFDKAAATLSMSPPKRNKNYDLNTKNDERAGVRREERSSVERVPKHGQPLTIESEVPFSQGALSTSNSTQKINLFKKKRA